LIKYSGLSRRKLFLLAYPVLLLFSGIWQNPLFACIISAVYLLGLYGLVLLFDCRLKPDKTNRILYGFLGVMLLFICWVWLEILVKVMPFVSAS
jgi:signal transduction histidine kinase